MAHHELALSHHRRRIGEIILREADGAMVKSGGVLSTRLTVRLALTRSPSLSRYSRGKGQAQAILAVIQALVPDDAIAAVVGQGQGEDGHAPALAVRVWPLTW